MRTKMSKWPMKTPMLGKIIDEKRARRLHTEETDLLERAGELEDILGWLTI